MARQGREPGSVHAAPAHVADDGPPLAVGDGEHVVEVATDIDRLVGGQVPSGELDARDVRERAGEQACLEPCRGVAELRVQPSVLDRDRSAAGELLHEHDVVGRVAAPRVRRRDGERAERASTDASGTTMPERNPTFRSASYCSSDDAAARRIWSVASGTNLLVPVRSTSKIGLVDEIGHMLAAIAASSAGSCVPACSNAARCRVPSSASTSIVHQSAMSGTSALAMCASVVS